MKYNGILIDLDQTLANTEDFMLGSIYQETIGDDKKTAEYQVYKYIKDYLKFIDWEQFKEEYQKAKKEVKFHIPRTASSHNRYLYIQKTLENLGANFNSELIHEATNLYWEYVNNNCKLFDGAMDFLRNTDLFGLPVAMITDQTADIQIRKLMSLGISEYIDYLITSEETGADKPDEKILDVTLEKIKINKEKLILIGNNPEKDIPIAVNNGIDAILVDTYGVHNDQKEESTYYVMDFNEINEILNFYPEEFTQDKLIILDLIGTLTKHNHLRSEVLTKEFELSLNHVTEPYEQYKVNEIPKKEFWKKLGIENYKEAEERLLSYMELKPEAIKLIKKLQGKAKLAILSNIPKDWGEAIIKNNNLTKYFDKIILSGEVEMLKSKPEMYKLLTEEFPKILPENMYFVDNELEDLLSGKDFLLNTIWFSQEKPDAKFIPDYIVKTFDELDELLFNLIRS